MAGSQNVDKLARFDAEESLARHADDGICFPPDLHRAAQYARIGLKTPRPIIVTDDRNRMAPGNAIFVGGEHATQGRRNSQDVERLSRNELPHGLFDRRIGIGDLNLDLLRPTEKSQSRGISRGGPKLEVERIAEGFILSGRVASWFVDFGQGEPEQAIRLGHRQRPQHGRIDDGIDRSIGADGQSKRQNRSDGKCRALEQSSPGVAKVLQRAFEYCRQPDFAALLAQLSRVAEADRRLALRFLRAHASLTQSCGAPFQVVGHFFAKLIVQFLRGKRILDSRNPGHTDFLFTRDAARARRRPKNWSSARFPRRAAFCPRG